MSSLKDFQVGGFHNRLKGRLDMNKTTVPPTVAEAMRLALRIADAVQFYGYKDWHSIEAKDALEAYLVQLLQPTEQE